jgi:hypothetical protein
MSNKIWEAIVKHVSRGEEAEKLLAKIYLEYGPYKNDNISDQTWEEIKKFFNFDDSE